jgi:hypothetical protein
MGFVLFCFLFFCLKREFIVSHRGKPRRRGEGRATQGLGRDGMGTGPGQGSDARVG